MSQDQSISTRFPTSHSNMRDHRSLVDAHPTGTAIEPYHANRAVVPKARGGLWSCCGLAARVDARQNYQQSTAAYRACLDANSANLSACDAKRLALEADERAYNTLSAPLTRLNSDMTRCR
jgi:hypothetical protein